LAAKLLEKLLGSQAPALVLGHSNSFGAEMTVSKAHGEVSRVVVHKLHQRCNAGRTGIGLLDIDST